MGLGLFIRIRFGLTNAQPYTIMTDTQKGILAVLDQELTSYNVRFCARHILANVKTKVKNRTIPRRLATNDVDLKDLMERILVMNPIVTNTQRHTCEKLGQVCL